MMIYALPVDSPRANLLHWNEKGFKKKNKRIVISNRVKGAGGIQKLHFGFLNRPCAPHIKRQWGAVTK
tara:strand:- start:3039 stop:3242 length:204 start_codon:yes stop_codon:yes gene_type:complete